MQIVNGSGETVYLEHLLMIKTTHHVLCPTFAWFNMKKALPYSYVDSLNISYLEYS